MTESARKAKHYVERYRSIYEQMAELQADLKEVDKESKGEGYTPAMLKRWAKALADDNAGKLAFTLMEMTTIGETVAPTLFDALPQADEPTEEEDAVTIAKGAAAARRQTKRILKEMVADEPRAPETPAHDADGVIIESAAAPETPASDGDPTPPIPDAVAPAADEGGEDDEPKASLKVAKIACGIARLSVTDPAGAKAVVDTVEALRRENQRNAGMSAGLAPTTASPEDVDLKAACPTFLRRGWA